LAYLARAEPLTLGPAAVKAIRESRDSDDPVLRFRGTVNTLEHTAAMWFIRQDRCRSTSHVGWV
jgi:hypothetical protein